MLPASMCYKGSGGAGGSHHLCQESKHGEIVGAWGQVGCMGHGCPVGASHCVGHPMRWWLLMGIAACYHSGCGQRDCGCLNHSWSGLGCSHTGHSNLNGVTGLGAGLTRSWSIHLDVGAHVLGEVLAAGEGLPACATSMGFLPRMSEHVAPQVLIADEGLATNPTLVGPWHRLTIVVEASGRTTRAATPNMASAGLPRVVTGGGGGHH